MEGLKGKSFLTSRDVCLIYTRVYSLKRYNKVLKYATHSRKRNFADYECDHEPRESLFKFPLPHDMQNIIEVTMII